MGNAPTGVKQQADFVTASNEADGKLTGFDIELAKAVFDELWQLLLSSNQLTGQ